MLSCDFRRLVAVALVLTTTFITMPVSAADFSSARPVIGSVTAIGGVDLRGVGISQEGTLFAGDNIRSHEKGFAKVLLGTGSKIELLEKTDVSVNRDTEGVKIAMNTGTIGFTASSPLRIDVMPFEVIASDGSSGNVAVMSSTTAGVRARTGKVTVRNLKTSESFIVAAGQERLLGLKNGIHAPSLGEIASNVPGPVPAPRQTPAGKTGGGLAMDTGAWLAVIGGAALATIAIWGLVVALDNRNNTDDLKKQITGLNSTIAANNAATQAQLKNIANAQAIAAATSSQQAQLASVQALAGQAQLALTVAGSPQAATAAGISAQAAASAARLATLQASISAAQARLAAGTGSAAEVTALLQAEEVERTNSNNLSTQLNNLLNATRTIPGVPSGSAPTTGPPPQISASIPV